jgi:poly-gamma-glutamate capsule biosynthesis protein CapA/YwtB (metallophosphatase superfamily)
VVVHWSDELFSFPRPADREIARALAGMGADIVIGHHPHVVRGMEVIGNCPVFYSLGNFYFAETSSAAGERVREAPRNREGLGVKLIFQKGQAPQYELLSFWNNDHEARQDRFQRASRRLISTSRPLQKYRGDAYLAWYKKQRAYFDKWTIRWHFSLMQRGVIGTLQKIAGKHFKLPLMSR